MGGAGYDDTLPSLIPFMFVERDEKRGNIGVIAFGAYNAMGLIGSEKGGVAIVLNYPTRMVFATKDLPWKPKEREALVNRLLTARTAVGVIRKAELEEGFGWRIAPKGIKNQLTMDVRKGVIDGT